MPWINKIKYPKEEIHECSPPGVSWRTRTVAVNSNWECRKCGRIWIVTSVKQYSNGHNHEITFTSSRRVNGQKGIVDQKTIVRHEPYDI